MKILKNFISVDALEKRWGLNEEQLEAFVFERGRREPRLIKWAVKGLKKGEDGNFIAIVRRTSDISNCIFDMDEVSRWDWFFPELKAQEPAESEIPTPSVPSGPGSPQHVTPEKKPTRTAAASVASQEKTLAAWKAVIPAMCAVYHEYLAEGPRTRTRNEIERDFTRQGAKLSKAQLDFFRSFLPEGHVNKNGGATVQKS